ncbi:MULTISPECIES: geranylgeranylglycerol-phosphate geranylgeranyltransferase [Halobacterium]|uniref:geranylgeranylglycerol-phosphate geranylgeranyltransferase n=1 Tax=Halobacterium TaxID=2239 RepID=UPI001963C83D|nr:MULTISPECIES: geranylgeranylglycerol-phosphate geranylgeranyltransferase [Halobacterium]MDL0121303.1 geranylgeranylglycerol-phosphate geranylgeranyltransferase [Halobacterium salinarum]MDL0132581.1 geranylgeranylglycerol-phosphate geranylgeranyltransferase [Halobacterium salinarum]QRY25263.1 geranylgeranylglycerol-phosphate geranylgeranyltransferase [Halobacterium sp. BOL4-2]
MGTGVETGRGLVELARPVNTLAAGALTFIGAFVAGGAVGRPAATGAAVGATWLATAGGNAINDYFDREVDRINDPDRAIPRGAVSPRGALAYSVVLFVGAAALAATLPVLAVCIAALNLAGLLTYTQCLKGRPGAGNALVAYLGGSTFVFGAAAVGSPLAGGVLAALAALSTFAREVIKDVEDLAGDRAAGLRTLPVVVGHQRALAVSAVFVVGAAAASPVPYLVGVFGWWYLVAVCPGVVVMVVAAARSYTDPAAGQRLLKRGQLLAAAAFVVGRLVTP